MSEFPPFKGISYPQHNFESAYTSLLEIKHLLEIVVGIKSPGRRAAFIDELEALIARINVLTERMTMAEVDIDAIQAEIADIWAAIAALPPVPTAASTTEILTGTNTTKFGTPDSIAALWEKGPDVALAGTLTLGEGGVFNVTAGTGPVTTINFATHRDGRRAILYCTVAVTFTHSASLDCPGGVNLVADAGSVVEIYKGGSTVARVVSVTRNDGLPVVMPVASQIGFTPTGSIAATDVQAAIVEVNTENVAKAGDTMSGNLTISKIGPVFALADLTAAPAVDYVLASFAATGRDSANAAVTYGNHFFRVQVNTAGAHSGYQQFRNIRGGVAREVMYLLNGVVVGGAAGGDQGLGTLNATELYDDGVSLTSLLALKAPLASPALTGTPTAPTAANGTNTSQIATTAFVEAEAVITANALALKAPLASPVFTGNPTAPTPAASDNDTTIATTAYVTDAIAAAGPIGLRYFAVAGAFTYVPTAGTKRIKYTVTGAGGGGGGVNATAGTKGAGGGAGSSALGYLAISGNITGSIGTGGAAGSTSGGAGGAGGTTTFGGISCPGGGGGGGGTAVGTAANGGVGGTGASGGDLHLNGGSGAASAAGADGASGNGGASVWGGGGRGLGSGGSAGQIGQAPGSGGGGATSNGAGLAGGAGNVGIVVIEEFG